ncbi:MAG: hypothetical protein CMI01_16825 [Oceanospirillaceae bacterium]|nr:hypothetical protein [Oceanospirillaceae bacterium]
MESDKRRTKTKRGRHPSLANTLHLGIFGLFLLFLLSVWLAMPLLEGIVTKAQETRDTHLPAITRGQHNAQRAEQLYSYINTLFWVEDDFVARQARLQAQVLVHSFAFEAEPEISNQANSVLDHVLSLATTRREQRQIILRLGDIAIQQIRLSEALEETLNANTSLVSLSHQLMRLAAGTRHASIHSSDWGALIRVAQAIQRALVNTETSAPTPSIQTRLDAIRTLLSAQLESLNRMIILEKQAEDFRQASLAAQQALTGMLNSDAAYRTQQLAERMESDALQVKNYTLALLALFVVLGSLLLFCFNRLVLRPILVATHALERVGQGDVPPPFKHPVLFSELNAICSSVKRYGDMTLKLQRANEELQQLSQLDGLTGLGNRRRFDTALNAEWDRACRHGHSLCLIIFDIDHFKQINDRHGHLFGDDCLRAFAHLLERSTQRAGEVAARYGGEEFILILPEINLPAAKQIAERIRQAVHDLHLETDGGEPVKMTISGGLIHTANARLCPTATLLREVDNALYQAKREGRDRIVTVSNGPGITLCTGVDD